MAFPLGDKIPKAYQMESEIYKMLKNSVLVEI